MRLKIITYAFLAIVLAAFLNFGALYFRLYWSTSWFDVIVHFTAGVSVGLASIWLIYPRLVNPLSKKGIFAVALLGALVIGVAWEIFELYIGVVSFYDGVRYVTDTILDIICDLAGGLLAAYYVFIKLSGSSGSSSDGSFISSNNFEHE